MEELRSEDLEKLVQELEEEDGVQDQAVEELLRVLQSGSLYLARQDAAERLGSVGTSSARIVQALMAAYESEPYPEVARAAAKSLRAPVHREYAQQHPDLLKAVQIDLLEAVQREVKPAPGLDDLEAIRSRLGQPAKRYDRKQPVGSSSTLLWILAGMFFLGLGILSWRESSGWIFVLLGVVIIVLALRSWLAPSSARGMLRRATKETVGMVDRFKKVKGDDDYGPKYLYLVTLRFEADEPSTGTRVIALTARVAHHIWKRMEIGSIVGIRYAAEDPSIALIEGEW